jgi:hypothetical protein
MYKDPFINVGNTYHYSILKQGCEDFKYATDIFQGFYVNLQYLFLPSR